MDKVKYLGRNYTSSDQLIPKLAQGVEELRDKLVEIFERLEALELLQDAPKFLAFNKNVFAELNSDQAYFYARAIVHSANCYLREAK